jgi:H+/Cl- antiporter ClcA
MVGSSKSLEVDMTGLDKHPDGPDDRPMKRHEQWAVVVASVAVLLPLLQLSLSTASTSQPWNRSWWWMMAATSFGGLLARVAVGLWLYFTAQRDGHSPIVWFAMGVVFSILAAILYFLLRVLYRDLESARRGEGLGRSPN